MPRDLYLTPSRGLRFGLVALTLLAASWSVAQYLDWRAEQRRLRDFLDRAALNEVFPELRQRVRRANNPMTARLRATRPLVAYYLDPVWLLQVPQEQQRQAYERSVATLAEIQALSAEAMARRPTSWEAAMVHGASTYLLQPGSNLAVSTANLDTWERPLRRAEELNTGYLEPARYLAVAYVRHWQSLSSQQRKTARETLRRAFSDTRTFNLIIEHWLRLVPDRREALALVPDEPFAWERLARIFERRTEWALYLECRSRYAAAENRRLSDLLEEAEARVAGGDYRRGTDLFHSAARAVLPDVHNLALIERVLDRMPAGPVSAAAARGLRGWLEWALELGLVGEVPLSPERLRRLVGHTADIRLYERALASLLAGDLAAAEQSERRRQGPFDRPWGPYLILKSEALLERGAIDDARLSLLRVDESWSDHPTYLRAGRALAEARGDVAAIEEIDGQLDVAAAERWKGGQMLWSDTSAQLTAVPSRSASGLVITFLETPPHGQPIEVLWNGASQGVFVTLPGEPLEVEVDVERRPSLLELRSADRRPFTPGVIALKGAAPAAR